MKQRYSSIDELANDFNNAAEPGIIDRLRNNWKFLTAATVLGASLVGLGSIPLYSSIQESRAVEKAEAEKYEVVAGVDGIGLEIKNNLFDMEFQAFNTSLPDKPIPSYPNIKFISAKPGDRIYTHTSLISKPLPKKKDLQWGIPTLEGRVYLEGMEGETLHISPRNVNGAISYEM
nr:hypothetical protein [Candidatus Nanoarchaeia archaeon]